MKRVFSILTALFGIFCLVGCGNEQVVGGGDYPTPVISIEEVEVTAESYTFTVTTDVAGTLGYVVAPLEYDAPRIDQWFESNSVTFAGSKTITVDNLNSDTDYALYAILRASRGGNLSLPHRVEFTTPDDGRVKPIVIHNATYDTISFTINLEGSYVFNVIDHAYLEYNKNLSIEEYISTPGIGIPQKGPLSVDWENGGYWGNFPMHVREDSDYYVVAMTDAGDIYYKEVRTPKRPISAAGVTVEFTEIGSTSVGIKTTPDATVKQYYVLVKDKEWSDDIVANYGESMLATMVKYPSTGSWFLTSANQATWEGLTVSTDYYCHILVIDNKEAQALTRVPFKTTGGTLSAPTIELSVSPDAESGHNTLSVNLYCADAESASGAVLTQVKVNGLRASKYTDADIIANYGTQLSAEQVAAIKSTGLTLKQEDLFPELDYVALVSVKNRENTESVKVVSAKTNAKPIPARVESELFTSLLGKWTVSYSLYQFNDKYVDLIDGIVTIAQGADDDTADYYRSHNRLVVQGWAFNVEHDGTHNPIPYYSPSDLKEADATWRDNPILALRDYGPKIFLEIGEGDVITIPTSRGEFLYNWSPDGTFYFFGGDLENGQTAPVTFPVTLLEDGDTMIIGAYAAGAEFDNGTYRPSVFRNDLIDYRAIATGNVILKRVK